MITKNIQTHWIPTDHHRNVIIDFVAYARKVSIKKQNQKHTMISSSVSGARSAFFSSHAIRWILFLMCTKKTASKQVSKDKEQQIRAKKQFFQVSIYLYLWKLIDSGLYQRIKQHYNNSSQSGYSTRLKLNNLINRYS